MKKIVRILFAALIAAALTGCTDAYKQFQITGGSLESPTLGPPMGAVLSVDVNNPTYKVVVTDVSGKVKKGERHMLDLTAEDFTVPARSASTVKIPVTATMAPGVGLLSIGRVLASGDYDDIVVDLTFTASGFLGFKKTQTIENIPVKDLISLL